MEPGGWRLVVTMAARGGRASMSESSGSFDGPCEGPISAMVVICKPDPCLRAAIGFPTSSPVGMRWRGTPRNSARMGRMNSS